MTTSTTSTMELFDLDARVYTDDTPASAELWTLTDDNCGQTCESACTTSCTDEDS